MSHERRTPLSLIQLHRMHYMWYCGLIVSSSLILMGTTPVLAEDWRVSLSTSFNYLRGDYGTDSDTTLIYVPFTVRVAPTERLTLGVTVPYIRLTSQNIVLTGGGVAVRNVGERRTEGGLGDLLLRGEYILVQEQPIIPEIMGLIKIKAPTADEDKGLGTGEFDETLGLSFSKTFAQRLVTYLDLTYTFIGSPPGVDFDNTFGWSIGAAYRVARPVTLYGFLDGATAVSPDQDDPLELRFGAEVRVSEAIKLTGSITVGLTDGSPDYGLSGGLVYRF
jgi:Putative MetA-pathway of phenol degradation